MLNRKQHIFILVALCFLVYANTLGNEFISDDLPTIVDNPSIGSFAAHLFSPPSLLNTLDFYLGHLNPFVYHLTNILLHVLGTVFVYLFLQLLFTPVASLIGAALFAVHPMHTEAVTWISGRGHLVIGVFLLGTFLLYHYATSRIKDAGHKGWYILSIALFAYFIVESFSFYSFFPLLIVMYDVFFRKWRLFWKYWLPFFAIVAVRLFLAHGLITQRITSVGKEIGMAQNWTNPFFNMVYSVFVHGGMLLWPARLTLYHEPPVITALNLRIGLIALSLIVVSLPYIYRKAKEMCFALLLFLLFMAPTYSPWMISWLIAERYTYFSSVGLSMFAAFVYYQCVKKHQQNSTYMHWCAAVTCCAIAGYSMRTVVRNEDWRNASRFWRATAETSPLSPRAHNNLGDAYAREGNVQATIHEFQRAIELKPGYADAYHNLANTYTSQGNIDAAVQLYNKAIEYNPELFESYFNLGVIYTNRGEMSRACEVLMKALVLRPDDQPTLKALEFARQPKKVQ